MNQSPQCNTSRFRRLTLFTKAHAISMHASGVDIPPELFEHLLWHVQLESDPLVPRGSAETATAVAVSKRTLGTFALVCRYFASLCRPRLFNGILLKSYNDLRECMALIDASGLTLTSISVYIRTVMVEPNADSRPWLHLLRVDLLSRLSRSVIIHLRISQPFFYAGLSPRTIQQGLPHAIPRALSCISSLTLHSLHFEQGRECIRIILELSLLVSLRLQEVTWGSTPEPSTFHRVNKRIDYVRVVESGAQIFPWLLVALVAHQWTPTRTRLARPDVLTWDVNEHAVVMELCRLLCAQSSSSTTCYWTGYRTRQDVDVYGSDDEPVESRECHYLIS